MLFSAYLTSTTFIFLAFSISLFVFLWFILLVLLPTHLRYRVLKMLTLFFAYLISTSFPLSTSSHVFSLSMYLKCWESGLDSVKMKWDARSGLLCIMYYSTSRVFLSLILFSIMYAHNHSIVLLFLIFLLALSITLHTLLQTYLLYSQTWFKFLPLSHLPFTYLLYLQKPDLPLSPATKILALLSLHTWFTFFPLSPSFLSSHR